ncbi:MAG: hypothetical protein K6G31_02120 [Paludibacteraceae bacterium]|nr:hypothetical protein [Paludibacteraceae bacterium]
MFLIDDLIFLTGCALVGGSIGGTVGFLVGVFLDEDTIKDEVKVKYPDALKLMIEEKKKKAVNVGIFGDSGKIASGIEIQSEKGVSDNLYVGQTIYL